MLWARTAYVPSGRKLLAKDVSLSIALAFIKKTDNTRSDLALLFGPANRPPLLNQIAKRLNPFIGACLFPPEIKQIHPAFRIDADHGMAGIVATIGVTA